MSRNKKIIAFGILAVVLVGIFVPVYNAHAQNSGLPSCPLAIGTAEGTPCDNGDNTKTCVKYSASIEIQKLTDTVECKDNATGAITNTSIDSNGKEVPNTNSSDGWGTAKWIFRIFAEEIGRILMTISSLFLVFAGLIFDEVLKITVTNMAANIGSGGIGDGITTAWATLRDIANMCFIFVLLYAAFKAMFQLDFGGIGTTIKNIIIVALLINFSLFFSKVVIDASNIVSVGFYNSITSSNVQLQGGGAGILNVGSFAGISGGYMNMLGLQTLYGSNILTAGIDDPVKILVIGAMSAIFMLVVAVILLISAIMFAARFIILIFIMILSPLALIAYIIPGLKGKFDDWLHALLNQSFFAPLFFALTWVVFKLGTAFKATLVQQGAGDFTSTFTNPSGTIGLLVNYVLIIGLAIAALIFSKQMATSGAMAKPFKAISGGIGTAAAGGTAWLGRKTVGLPFKHLSENAKLQGASTSKNFLARTGARAALYVSDKARNATFDMRNAAIPTSVVGDAIRGTVGRTGIGKSLGLNDVNISSVGVSSLGVDTGLLGKAGTKGYKELKEESNKRVHDREAAAKAEQAQAEAKKAVKEGAKSGANTKQIDAMEKALAKLSTKETETLVSSNRELLESQNFANKISVQQLEAINKSDQFSEAEKGKFKDSRFSTIYDTDNLAALTKLAATRTPEETVAAKKITDSIRSLSDSELEMISSNYLNPKTSEGKQFISQLKANQVETIIKNKGGKFTTTQQNNVKEERTRPLIEALDSNNPIVNLEAQNIARRADIKTKIGYLKIPRPNGTSIATDPIILPIYTPKMLQKMAAHDDMNDEDIRTIRKALIRNPNSTRQDTLAWLMNPDKGMIEFPG
jgi:hypothetical protein